jgi:hypothetical protein
MAVSVCTLGRTLSHRYMPISSYLHSILSFETGSYCVDQAYLQLSILLPLPQGCWDYMCVSKCLAPYTLIPPEILIFDGLTHETHYL